MNSSELMAKAEGVLKTAKEFKHPMLPATVKKVVVESAEILVEVVKRQNLLVAAVRDLVKERVREDG